MGWIQETIEEWASETTESWVYTSIEGSPHCRSEQNIPCLINNTCYEVGMRYFYPQCSGRNPKCNTKKGAWVPAITVCRERLL